MECCSLLTQKLHFIISVGSGSYAIETISEQSMGSKRQFLGQKKGKSGIIGKWYCFAFFFFFLKSSIATVEIWEKACWGSEQREMGRQKKQWSRLSLPSSVCSKFHVMCQHSSARHFCIFFTWERFGMRDTTSWNLFPSYLPSESGF